MSNAFNLSQLANNTNSSGQVALGTGVSGTLPIANGGTNNASLAVTAGGVVYTDGSKLVNVGAGTSGQVLQSNGASAPTWASAGGTSGVAGTMYSTPGTYTFTIPSGKTSLKAQLWGGGGGSGNPPSGGTGGTSSVSSGTQAVTTASATGGAGGAGAAGSTSGVTFGVNGTVGLAEDNVPVSTNQAGYLTGTNRAFYNNTLMIVGFGAGGAAVDGWAGSSGAYGIAYFTGLTPGNTLTITVGGGGSAGNAGQSGRGGAVLLEY